MATEIAQTNEHEARTRKQAARIVEQARGRISDPAGWSTDYYAEDSAGRPVLVDSPDAVRHCASGALMLAASEVGGRFESQERGDAWAAVRSAVNTRLRVEPHPQDRSLRHLEGMNDRSSHDQVVAFLDAVASDLRG